MPTIVCWRYDANALGVIDGAPYRFIASRSLGSPGPKRWTSAGSPRYRPCTWPTITGTATPALADRPARLNARVKENAVVLMVALASSMGADGSNATSPKLKLLTTVAMFNPLGIGQYAPGSSS